MSMLEREICVFDLIKHYARARNTSKHGDAIHAGAEFNNMLI